MENVMVTAAIRRQRPRPSYFLAGTFHDQLPVPLSGPLTENRRPCLPPGHAIDVYHRNTDAQQGHAFHEPALGAMSYPLTHSPSRLSIASVRSLGRTRPTVNVPI